MLRNFWAAVHYVLPLGKGRTETAATLQPDPSAWIVPLGIVIGLLWAGSFRLTWWLYGEIGSLRVVPSLAVLLIDCLLTSGVLLHGLVHTCQLLTGPTPCKSSDSQHEPLSYVAMLALCLAILSQYLLILSIPAIPGWWPPPDDWRHHFNFLYPKPIYRPLILAPIWGRWGILLAATIGRTARDADAETRALNAAMRPRRLLRHAIPLILITAIYSSRASNYFTGIMIGLVVFGMTFLLSVIMARRRGGQTRQTYYAAGFVAQLVFLAVYRAMWRLIEG